MAHELPAARPQRNAHAAARALTALTIGLALLAELGPGPTSPGGRRRVLIEALAGAGQALTVTVTP